MKSILRVGGLPVQVNADVNVALALGALITHQVPFGEVIAVLALGWVTTAARARRQR